MATRVGVNLLWCVPGKVGGSEEYLTRQLLGLHELAAAGDAFAGDLRTPTSPTRSRSSPRR
jgi:hypothetical protein